MTISEDLRKAKNAIVERGWGQGHYKNEDGCLCALGAMRVAAWGTTSLMEAPRGWGKWYRLDRLSDIFLEASGIESVGTVAWNDTPGRTKDEVLAAFDRAIALTEKREASIK